MSPEPHGDFDVGDADAGPIPGLPIASVDGVEHAASANDAAAPAGLLPPEPTTPPLPHRIEDGHWREAVTAHLWGSSERADRSDYRQHRTARSPR